MNYYAYRTTGLAIKTLYNLSRARVRVHGAENIPDGANIFAINHFTRIETLLLPYQIYKLTGKPVWSMAAAVFFKGALANLLDLVGAVSTKDPDRDRLIVKTLLTAEAGWIIFPEGRMVKTKKTLEHGRFMISTPEGEKHAPRTGAAALGLRAEFYRRRLERMREKSPDETKRLMELFGITDLVPVLENRTRIVPVNVTYYPIRARENVLSALASRFVDGMDQAAVDEIMTEGSMLISGVDIDIRFGKPIDFRERICIDCVQKDIESERRIDFDDLLPSRHVMRKIAYEIMNEYMSAIYAMTTVNHDHFFATALKHYPFRKIKEPDLRRRVYCGVMGGMEKKEVFFHESLRRDQISLLTDDRYGKYEEFVRLALEKKALVRKKGRLVKNREVFSSPSDFHRSRMDNTVAVIANEVEGLKRLQRSIRPCAWTPGFVLRRMLARRLQREAVAEFQRDFEQYSTRESPKDRTAGKPFLVRGSFRKPAVLLIHGYLAAPAEVRPLALYLADRGFAVYVPRLKGHGTSPEDLAKRTYADWRESVDKGYAVAKCLRDRVVVGGFSTGAGLALDLAVRIPDVAGVFTVCSPLRVKFMSTKLASALDAWNRMLKKIRSDEAEPVFVEIEPENPTIKYRRNPVSGIREVEHLMASLEPRLGALKIPALVIQSLNDPVVDSEGSMQIFQLLGSEEKSYLMFDMDRHVIVGGEGAHRVHKAVGDFVEGLNKK